MKSSQIVFLCFLALSLATCKKNKIKLPLDKEFFEYFGAFKDGSWWVLQEDNHGWRDSVFITDYHPGYFEDGGNQTVEYIAHHHIYNQDDIAIKIEMKQEQDNITSLRINGNTYLKSNGTLSNEGRNDSISIVENLEHNGHTFQKTIRIKTDYSVFLSSFYARNLGLVVETTQLNGIRSNLYLEKSNLIMYTR